MKLKATIFFIALLVGSGFQTLRAQGSQEDTIAPKTVSINATRSTLSAGEVPASINVLDQRDIQGIHATTSLEESLRSVPGVFVNNRHNPSLGERISIRGLGSRAQYGIRSIQMVLDGIPLTFPDGTTQINNLDMGFIGRMEILRGPAATLYGNAAGGTIYMQSQLPTDSITFTPRLTVGSYGLVKFQAEFSGRSNQTSYFVNAGGWGTNGYRHHSKSRSNNLNGIIKQRWNEDSKTTFIINAVQSPYLMNPSSLDKEAMDENPAQVRDVIVQQAAGKAVMQGQLGLSHEQALGENDHLTSTLFGVSRNLYNPIFGRIIDLKRLSGGWHNVYRHQWEVGQSRLILLGGADLELQYDDRSEYENPGLSDSLLNALLIERHISALENGDLILSQTEQVFNSGLFTVGKWHYQQWTVSAGLRWDFFDFRIFGRKGNELPVRQQFDNWSPTAGIAYQFGQDWQAFANYSTAFQTPTANEFSNDPAGAGFNDELQPECTQSIETGVKKLGRQWQGGLTGFYFTVDNKLISYQVSGQSEVTYYRNAGKTANKGLEVWLKYQPNNRWSFETSYTVMDYQFKDYEIQSGHQLIQLAGNKVPGVPGQRLFGNVGYRQPTGLSAQVDVQYVGKYYAQDMNISTPASILIEPSAITNESYWVTDVRLGYETDFKKFGLRFFGGINNILDVQYSGSVVPNAFGGRFFEPAAGRHFYVGIEVPIRG